MPRDACRAPTARNCPNCPGDWRLSASLEAQLRASLKPLNPSQHYRNEGFKKGLQLRPHYAKRCQSLGQRMRVFLPVSPLPRVLICSFYIEHCLGNLLCKYVSRIKNIEILGVIIFKRLFFENQRGEKKSISRIYFICNRFFLSSLISKK